ncbi:MAG: hypothetical protein FJY98_02420 [Candidatus Liptonbacteria bacterium]|nr:hypothetical protein [Candidatus Liptonbacteria bacterium]
MKTLIIGLVCLLTTLNVGAADTTKWDSGNIAIFYPDGTPNIVHTDGVSQWYLWFIKAPAFRTNHYWVELEGRSKQLHNVAVWEGVPHSSKGKCVAMFWKTGVEIGDSSLTNSFQTWRGVFDRAQQALPEVSPRFEGLRPSEFNETEWEFVGHSDSGEIYYLREKAKPIVLKEFNAAEFPFRPPSETFQLRRMGKFLIPVLPKGSHVLIVAQ